MTAYSRIRSAGAGHAALWVGDMGGRYWPMTSGQRSKIIASDRPAGDRRTPSPASDPIVHRTRAARTGSRFFNTLPARLFAGRVRPDARADTGSGATPGNFGPVRTPMQTR